MNDLLAQADKRARSAKSKDALASAAQKADFGTNRAKDLVAKQFIFAILVNAGVKPLAIVYDYQAITERKFQFDVCVPSLGIAVDVHGATYSQGAHTRGKGYQDDRMKARLAILDEWIYLEFCQGKDLRNARTDLFRAVERQRARLGRL